MILLIDSLTRLSEEESGRDEQYGKYDDLCRFGR